MPAKVKWLQHEVNNVNERNTKHRRCFFLHCFPYGRTKYPQCKSVTKTTAMDYEAPVFLSSYLSHFICLSIEAS